MIFFLDAGDMANNLSVVQEIPRESGQIANIFTKKGTSLKLRHFGKIREES